MTTRTLPAARHGRARGTAGERGPPQPAPPSTHAQFNQHFQGAQHDSHREHLHSGVIADGSSGIGRELAQQALNAGESIAVLSRKGADLDDGGDPSRLLTIEADVRDEAAVRDGVEQAVARSDRIDVVANNADYGLAGAVEETTDAQARAVFDTNFFGALNVLRAALPVLRRQRSGHILQGSGALGQTAFPGQGLVTATKHAFEGVSDALAIETAPLGITVTIVEPGPTATGYAGSEEPAALTLPDYDQTIRAPQGGIPVSDAGRVAAGIRSAVASGNPPRRLALGTVSVAVMRASLDARLAQPGHVGRNRQQGRRLTPSRRRDSIAKHHLH